MKVIKHGNTKDDKPKKATCASCKCKMEFVKKDIKTSNDPRESDSSEYIICPECGNWIYIYV